MTDPAIDAIGALTDRLATCEAKYPPNWQAAHEYWRKRAEDAETRLAALAGGEAMPTRAEMTPVAFLSTVNGSEHGALQHNVYGWRGDSYDGCDISNGNTLTMEPLYTWGQLIAAFVEKRDAPRRCAECDCEGGEIECTWMKRQGAWEVVQPTAVTVKPLVWGLARTGRVGDEWHVAKSIGLEYSVRNIPDRGWHWTEEGMSAWFPSTSEEAAKCAVQADHDAKVREVLALLDVQPITVQDAARVPEIAALIEKSEALRADVTGRVDAFGERIGAAQPMIGFSAKQWADFITALRTIAEERA